MGLIVQSFSSWPDLSDDQPHPETIQEPIKSYLSETKYGSIAQEVPRDLEDSWKIHLSPHYWENYKSFGRSVPGTQSKCIFPIMSQPLHLGEVWSPWSCTDQILLQEKPLQGFYLASSCSAFSHHIYERLCSPLVPLSQRQSTGKQESHLHDAEPFWQEIWLELLKKLAQTFSRAALHAGAVPV